MRKILLVSKDETMANQYAFSFEAVNYVVETFVNADVDVEQITTLQNHDAVLVDTEIPTEKDIETVGRLRQADLMIPLIVLSFNADKWMLIELMRRGCSDFIEKPVGFGELYTRIEDDIENNIRTQNNLQRSRVL